MSIEQYTQKKLWFFVSIFAVLFLHEVRAATLDAHWTFEGNSTNDTVNTHNLQAGSVGYTTDSARGAIAASFDGSTQYLSYSDGTFLNQAIRYFSYAFWVKPTAGLTGIQQLLDEGGTLHGLAIRLNDGVLECGVQKQNDLRETQSFTFPNDGLWHHIAVTYDNGKVILYLDGEASTTLDTESGELPKHTSDQAFGKNSNDAFDRKTGTDYLTGLMDDIRHYADGTQAGSVLTQADINTLVGCGAPDTSSYALTAFQWRVISFPCDTGNNGIEQLLGTSLGTYGDENNWVMYKQNNTNYTGHPTTDMTLMSSTDTVVAGKGYWIIADSDRNASIDTQLSNLSRTDVEVDSNYAGVDGGTLFYDVLGYTLPNSDSVNWKKVMIGNPFTKKLQLSDVFFANGGDTFKSMADVNGSIDAIQPIVYAHDSAALDPFSYMAITPDTPGFTDIIEPMLGVWIKLNEGNSNTNQITYPYETQRIPLP